MDERRFDTGQVIDAGILNLPVPKTDEPEDRERQRLYVDDDPHVRDAARYLDEGAVIDCSEYYGIPVAWKTDEGYRAILLQYRSVSESHLFATVEECADWFAETAFSVAG